MRGWAVLALVVAFGGGAGAVGFWAGQQQRIEASPGGMPPSPPDKNVADRQDQSGSSAEDPAKQVAPSTGSKKIIFYRNPMGLPDTSPVPKKDWMGMDYIAVYEGEEKEDAGTVKVSIDRVQKLGVRTEPAEKRRLEKTIRANGTVQIDEKRQQIISMRYEGYIERLLVSTTGQSVRRGEALMEIYSPELVLAQQEYIASTSAARDIGESNADLKKSVERIAEATLQRLRNLDAPQGLIEHLKRGGAVRRVVTLHAPSSGVVIKKNAIQGMRFMPGDQLYQISDISRVWLIANVFEQDVGLIREGQVSRILVNAFPGTVFEGKVDFIYPVVARETRTAQVRIEVPNADGRLRADMYATVEIAAGVGSHDAVTVPVSAVLDSGTRQAVLIDRGEGKYEPRPVKLGARTESYVEVLAGIAPDEKVVVSANFLIDAESNLRAALGAFVLPKATPPESVGAVPPQPETKP